MSTPRFIVPAIAGLVLAALPSQEAEAQFSKLVQRVPGSVNTIILLNAEKVMTSEIALREGWRTNWDKAIAAGLTHLPSDTQQYVLAAQIDFEYMRPEWELGILTSKNQHSMVYVASKHKGSKQDTIAGLSAILLPSNNYLVQFDPMTYGILVPASRQAVARWINATSESTPKFSNYIQEAIGYSEEAGTEIIMAMDLTDVLDLETARNLVSESQPLKEAAVDTEAAAKVLASLRGVMLGVTLGSKSHGSIKVDFGEDASVLKGVAADLLAEALAKEGAMIDDFKTWKGNVDGKQLLLAGDLSASGMRQLFSLMDPPTAKTVAAAPEDNQGAAGQQLSPVEATQKYFAAVNQYIRDLRAKEPQRIAQYGIWFDKYARKIDQLPMVNVDNDMLDYGAYVAQQFRNAGAAIQGIGVRSRVRQVNAVNSAGSPSYWGPNFGGYGGGYYYNGYSWGGANVVGSAAVSRVNAFNWAQQEGLRQQQSIRTQVKVQERAIGTSAARQIMKDIDAATAQMRRAMTQKYNVEFQGLP